ncbi:CopD family protein [Methylomarinum sp. Ch1-1]|uniref:Copper resistance protein D n=1 Tax=Methylomarinum roseum TaxID=3067653 RepID=A0AAU7NSA8_9GAMM|nr:CopD family protein [Methylomarinum sp. Ch1-1]MDP4520118.1 CopD family protein [Methylomarinum sp. Ch1-1]
MEGIADFLDSLIGGVDLTFYSLAVGGLIWGIFVLRPWDPMAHYTNKFLSKSVHLTYVGAYTLVITQLAKIVLKIWLMTATLERWPFPAFANTVQFQAGLIRAFFALILALYIRNVLKHNFRITKYWLIGIVLALPMVISGAWLVHGASRLEDRELLMLFTVIHQVSAAVWVGSVFQLLSVWRMKSKGQINEQLWPALLWRFSPIGIVAVISIVASGLPIALHYFDSLNSLIGTGYGNLLLVKILMLGIALFFAGMNRRAVHDYFLSANNHDVNYRVPYYIEAEAFVLVTLLFTAASLASQPPAIDIPHLTASWQEVLNTFAPRIPRIESPSHEALLAGEEGRVAIVGQVPSEAATAWSDYNHNVSGIFLTIMSIFAMLSYYKKLTWAKYWPIGFVLLGIFLFFRSDAETWPLGPIGFWESTFNNGEVLQHRIATLLVFMLGLLEMKARLTQDPDSKLPYLFPILAAFGGLMLLAHSHVGFEPKTAFLIQVGHTLMGLFALILACGRWLELKLDSPGKEIAGFISVFALFQIGIILLFYREPLY